LAKGSDRQKRCVTMKGMYQTRITGVFSVAQRESAPLATGVMVQPWMLLVVPPMDLLTAEGEGKANGTLRVLVAPLDDLSDAVTGSVAFSDPLDEGLLAAVQLDRDMPWPFRPIVFDDVDDEESTVHAVHRHLRQADRGQPAAATLLNPTVPWSRTRPETWPDGRSWPPSGDSLTHRGICSVIPCCWGCPANPRCVVPPPPVA
jgi:hypothetical protein